MPDKHSGSPSESAIDAAALIGDIAERIDNFATKEDLKAVNSRIEELRSGLSSIAVREPADEFGLNKRYKSLRHLKDAEDAYTFGMLVVAGMANNYPKYVSAALAEKANSFLKGRTTMVRGQVEGVDALGGYLVPEQISARLIDLREEYGVIRQVAYVENMSSDHTKIRRRSGGLTAYFTDEAASITESTKSWNVVSLTARKAAVLTRLSSELSEDAILNLGDDLAGEIAYAFAEKEDDCAINGDGTSTYGGIVGLRQRLIDVNGTDDGGGIVVASGNTFAEVALADFNDVIGRIPKFADNNNTCWIVHRTFWASVMQRLAYAAGGNDVMNIASGMGPTFAGYPVKISQKMPSTASNGSLVALFGDFTKACTFGNRRGTTIDFSEHRYFDTDELAIRGTERFDFVVHDVGTSTTAGPVVGLVLASV